MIFNYHHKVVVKRLNSGVVLGKYGRPVEAVNTVGTYPCMVVEDRNYTVQMDPQKNNSTGYTIYTDPEADILTGDVLYIYEVDEYGDIIETSGRKAVADKPYKKRTQLKVGLKEDSEV